MDFSTLYTRLGRRRGFDGSTARLKDFINDAIQEIVGRRSDWEWLRRQHQFQTRAPVTGSTGIYTNDSHAVAATGSSVTTTGALLSSPEDALYRVRAANSSSTTLYIPVPYPGATATGQSFKIYFDTYALPKGCTQIERLVVTGNGWQTPIPQESLLPSGMAVLTFNDTETYPRAYALDQHTQLPMPRTAPTLATAGGSLTGTFTYAYAYLNDATGEVGPLSPTASITHSGATQTAVSALVSKSDYSVRVFRSEAGGTELLFLADVAAGTTTLADGTADSALGVDSTTQEEIGAHPGDGGVHKIRLWPPPDEEYLVSLTYFARQKELVLDNEVPLIPTQYHHLILTLAESIALGEEENHRAAAQKRSIAMEGVDQMALEQDADPNRVAGVGRGELASRRVELQDGRWPRFVDT